MRTFLSEGSVFYEVSYLNMFVFNHIMDFCVIGFNSEGIALKQWHLAVWKNPIYFAVFVDVGRPNLSDVCPYAFFYFSSSVNVCGVWHINRGALIFAIELSNTVYPSQSVIVFFIVNSSCSVSADKYRHDKQITVYKRHEYA